MNESDLSQLILDVADELQTSPAFLEKDFYVSRVLSLLGELKSNHFQLAFGGGTSLLKAHKIIHRFSEDIDFKAVEILENTTRTDRKKFREHVLQAIDENKDLRVLENSVVSRNSSRFFACLIQYPKTFQNNSSIRPHIKFEVTFSKAPYSNLEPKNLKPLVGNYTDVGEHSILPCISPNDIMSDKMSAFAWRILSRNRET